MLGTIDIDMVPAVRNPDGACIDAHNCDYERYTLCAFDQSPSNLTGRIDFLECMDAPWSDPLTFGKVKNCSKKVGIAYDAVSSCFKGSRGEELLKEAAQTFTKAFPKPAYMPQASVNGKIVDADYDHIRAALCAAGSSAPVCN